MDGFVFVVGWMGGRTDGWSVFFSNALAWVACSTFIPVLFLVKKELRLVLY